MSAVTDHALIRWLERVGGIDMEYFRAEVEKRCADLIASGASGGWIDDHWVIVTPGGKIKTFLPDHPSKRVAA